MGDSNCKSTLLQSNSQPSLQSFTFYAAEVLIRESLEVRHTNFITSTYCTDNQRL